MDVNVSTLTVDRVPTWQKPSLHRVYVQGQCWYQHTAHSNVSSYWNATVASLSVINGQSVPHVHSYVVLVVVIVVVVGSSSSRMYN